jgi:hypothetical protein
MISERMTNPSNLEHQAYTETGFNLLRHLGNRLGMAVIAPDGKPAFTDRENEWVSRYVDRLNEEHKRQYEQTSGRFEYHPELLPYIQRTVVGFALRQSASAGEDQALWREKVGSLLKSWLFDSNPMTWIHVRELLRFADAGNQTGRPFWFFHKDELGREKREAVRIASLFPSYMRTQPASDIDLTTLAAAVVGRHIARFTPRRGHL